MARSQSLLATCHGRNRVDRQFCPEAECALNTVSMLKWQVLWQVQKDSVLKTARESRWVVPDSLRAHGLYPWDSPGQNTGVGSRSLLQGIFTTQGLNLGLPRCRRILYQLSPRGSLSLRLWDPKEVERKRGMRRKGGERRTGAWKTLG